MKIYHVKGTRAVRVIWLCEELDIGYEIEVVDFSPEYRNSPAWRDISPTGKVPAMTDGGLTMFESGAMVQYVLEKYGAGALMPEPGSAESALCHQWSWFAEATFARPLGEIINHNRVAPESGPVEFVIKDCRARATICLNAVESALTNQDYLVADAFSSADIMMGYTLMLAKNAGVLTGDFPKALAYFDRLSQRPGFQVAIAAG